VRILHFLGIGRLPRRPMVDATGGTERVIIEISRIQKRRGHEVTIAWMGDEAWEGRWEGVRLLHLEPYSLSRWRFGRQLRLANLIRFGRFDLVHLHEYLRTSFFESRPIVMQFHNNPLDGLDAVAFRKEAEPYWAQVGRSSTQIAVSHFVKGRLQSAHQEAGPSALPANIVTNYSAVHSKALSPTVMSGERARVRQELGLKDSDVLFLFAGALRPEKGVDYLARAFARLANENDNAYLAIAGGSRLWIESGWLWGKSLEITEREVLDTLQPAMERKRAFMLGIVSPANIGAYYAAADVFVLPSMFQETFGLVILEAFSAGLPVIAFRSGGIPELVEDRKNGILVDQGDEDGLFRSMRELMLDRDLRVRFGAEGEKTAARFSWETTVDRLEAIYQDILKPRIVSAHGR
jgi:glycosyltransferase involved in cell wall biosynthesis